MPKDKDKDKKSKKDDEERRARKEEKKRRKQQEADENSRLYFGYTDGAVSNVGISLISFCQQSVMFTILSIPKHRDFRFENLLVFR